MFDAVLVLQSLLILGLILLNGVFSMSEIAVVSSRRPRLKQRAEDGDVGARRALDLAERPTRFLSTVQVGITLIGVFAGAYGGASIAARLAEYLERAGLATAFAGKLALGVVVLLITYLSLVLGELLPKRIGLAHPERIASLIATPMQVLSRAAGPLVRLLTASTDGLFRLLPVRRRAEPPVTEEELAALLDAGTAAGVFEEEETELVERVLWLGDQRVTAIMTPRHRIEWLDLHADEALHRATLVRHRYSQYLVCDGELDRVVGMVRVKDLLADILDGRPLALEQALRKPLFVPESTRALPLLEMFRESGVHVAVVLDEYGEVEGLVTLLDVLEEITGSLTTETDPRVVQREDGSWLVDASLSMDEFWERLGLEERRSMERAEYNTVGGLVVTELRRIPKSGDSFDTHDLRFEVVDMDGHRVDKVLVTSLRPIVPERTEGTDGT